MNILFIAAECAPFAKVGGLGDVAGALPHTLSKLGHSVRVVLPHHGVIDDTAYGIQRIDAFDMPWNEGSTHVEVSLTERGGVEFYFIRGFPFFTADQAFVYDEDEGVNVGRYLFFCAAALRLVGRMAEREGWHPAIYHANDWHTAMVPYLLARVPAGSARRSRPPTLFSIHNMRYQGWGIGWHLARAGLPPVDDPLLAAMGRSDNCLAIGLAYSTMLSTVSPRYAQEIVTEEGGFGLDGLLHARMARLVGILNGIDVERWNPATSKAIAARFTAATLDRRVENKLALQAEVGLPQRADVPVAGVVTRLVEQKGPEVLIAAMRHMLTYAEMQFVLLGTGYPQHEADAWQLGLDFPEKAAVKLTFDEGLSERIYAGSDMFVMPSQFEPCGIGQMIAMRYGSLPVVRAVGGLADTVAPDVGFLFTPYHAGALQDALSAALDVYYNRPEEWHARQGRAMQHDYSWEASARAYVSLYEQAVALSRAYR